MLNHEGSHPEHFEELCALAASGQISEVEFIELQDHLQQCSQCRSIYTDFVDLLHAKLPLADPGLTGSSKLPGVFSKDSSYRERFLARARKEGLMVQEPSQAAAKNTSQTWFWPRLSYVQLSVVGIVVLLIAIGVLGYTLYETDERYMKLEADHAALKEKDSKQSGIAPQMSEKIQPTPPSTTSPGRDSSGTEAELAKVRADHAAAEAPSKGLEEQLSKLVSELETLRSKHAESSVEQEQLEKKLKETEQVANAVKEDLQELRKVRSKDSVTIATQDLEIQQLSEKLNEQTEMLQEQDNLLEASRDVRDLMGARNFHIADVYDVDSKGKDQRAFGRIFYTERKSTLIFYAFDLNDRNTLKRNASFQVWGKRGPAQGPTHSLGLFQIDDQRENRWVLRFEDPQILSQINSVFVTVEPPGGSAKPTGRQFLYAYLNANPNRQ